MEISSNKLLPYGPTQQTAGRSEAATPFKQLALSEQKKSEAAGEYQPRREAVPPSNESKLDYRQLVLQARYQQAGNQQAHAQGGSTYREGDESKKAQQALGAYRANAGLQEESGELMPRLDDYV
jgi:hypothetical protein